MDNLIYKTTLPQKQAFYDLFTITTNWNDSYQLNSEDLFKALKNSWFMISAYDNENLVGFARIISDGVVHALILDLIVHPEFQNRGIGSRLLEMLVEKCKKYQIRDIQLFSVKGKAQFYRKNGFKKRPEGAPGMEIKLLQ